MEPYDGFPTTQTSGFQSGGKKALSSGLPEKRQAVYTWNGADCVEGASVICEGLGYEGKAVAVEKKKELTFEFAAWETDSVEVEVRLLPNHPVEGERLRFTISLDGSATEAVSYETKGRSEEWKENVLCNQAVRRMILPVARKASHRLILQHWMKVWYWIRYTFIHLG